MAEDTQVRSVADSSRKEIVSVERSVHRIWSSILSSTNFGLDDDFFEVGGTPESAGLLVREIRRCFGYDLPLAAVYEASTIGGMAMLLRGSASRTQGRSLVCLQPGDATRPPIYCFHPLGGSVARYADLLDLLGASQPVYGLQSVGLAAGFAPDTTIEEMSDRYAREISSTLVGRIGIFLGYSLGGVLAMETARRIRDFVPVPPRVAIVDATPVSYSPDSRSIGYEALVKTVFNLDMNVEALATLPRDDALKRIRDHAADRSLLPRNFSLDRLRRFADVCDINHQAGIHYRPRWFGGPLTLFRSSMNTSVPWDLGWDAYVDQVTVHELTGDHHSIMEREGMSVIARMLDGLLGEPHMRESAGAPCSPAAPPREIRSPLLDAGR